MVEQAKQHSEQNDKVKNLMNNFAEAVRDGATGSCTSVVSLQPFYSTVYLRAVAGLPKSVRTFFTANSTTKDKYKA